jgi:molybdate transport system substrate-binding protein
MSYRLRTSPIAAITLVILVVLLAAGLAACGSSFTTTAAPATSTTAAPTTSTPGAKTLTVSAASSLKAAFTEIGAAFDAANGSTTTFNFDASGTLQKQIEGGAPVDVFASAAMKQVTALKDADLVDAATIKKFAGNEIVLVVPADSTLGLTGFQDLTKDTVKKIGYGDPKAAPHGVAAEEILTKLGILDQVKSKVVYAQNVSQALQYITSGEVDAGIIFATEALAGGDKVKVIAKADQSLYTKVAFPIAVISASKAKELGQAFVDYVTSADGQAILAKYGFLPAPADSSTTPSS